MDNNSEGLKLKTKSSVVQLFIAICGTFVTVFGLFMYNQHLLISLIIAHGVYDAMIVLWVSIL